MQVDKKFTKKEGKPFAVVWLEDLTGTLEVVLWNEVYVNVSDALVPGKVIAIQGTLDKRDDTVRATAQKVKVLTAIDAKWRGRPTARIRRPVPKRPRSGCVFPRPRHPRSCWTCGKSWLPRRGRRWCS